MILLRKRLFANRNLRKAIFLGLFSGGAGILLAFLTWIFIRTSPGILLLVGLSVGIVAAITFFIALRLRRKLSGGNRWMATPDLLIKQHGVRFLVWFIAHNLFWIALACVSVAFIVLFFGTSLWVFIYSAGAFAWAVYNLLGIFWLRKPHTLGICWQGVEPGRAGDFWTRINMISLLGERYEAAREQHRLKFRRLAVVLDRKAWTDAPVGVDLLERETVKRSALREFRYRLRPLMLLFSIAGVLAIPFFNFTQESLSDLQAQALALFPPEEPPSVVQLPQQNRRVSPVDLITENDEEQATTARAADGDTEGGNTQQSAPQGADGRSQSSSTDNQSEGDTLESGENLLDGVESQRNQAENGDETRGAGDQQSDNAQNGNSGSGGAEEVNIDADALTTDNVDGAGSSPGNDSAQENSTESTGNDPQSGGSQQDSSESGNVDSSGSGQAGGANSNEQSASGDSAGQPNEDSEPQPSENNAPQDSGSLTADSAEPQEPQEGQNDSAGSAGLGGAGGEAQADDSAQQGGSGAGQEPGSSDQQGEDLAGGSADSSLAGNAAGGEGGAADGAENLESGNEAVSLSNAPVNEPLIEFSGEVVPVEIDLPSIDEETPTEGEARVEGDPVNANGEIDASAATEAEEAVPELTATEAGPRAPVQAIPNWILPLLDDQQSGE